MIKPKLILIGAGGHTRACIDIIEQASAFSIAGLVGSKEDKQDGCLGYPVIATDDDLPKLYEQYQYALVTVGQIKSAEIRKNLFEHSVQVGFKFPTIVSPTAYVSRHAEVGDGTVVMHGAIVNAGARLGRNCIVNSRALIEHDAVVEDHCHISTGAVLNGAAKVGLGSFIGSGSVIKQGITLGNNCVVGMGIAVRHDHAKNSRILASNIL